MVYKCLFSGELRVVSNHKALGYSSKISAVDAMNTNQKGTWLSCLSLFPMDVLSVSISTEELESGSWTRRNGKPERQRVSYPFACALSHRPLFNKKINFQLSRETTAPCNLPILTTKCLQTCEME